MTTFFQSGNDGKRDTLIVTHPPHFPTMHTRETVTHLVAFGLDENQIAAVLKCTPDDVRRYYSEELEHGLVRVNSRVMSAVLHAALYQDSAADRKLWLTNKAGWKGDGAKALAIANPAGSGEDGEFTVVQRREVITNVLTRVTQAKRQQERVVDAVVSTVAKSTNGNGANGHGSNGHGANGHGSNGHGGSGNGVKHK